jgi:hypothetical protein
MSSRYVESDEHGKQARRTAGLEPECAERAEDESWLEQAEAEAEIEADWERDDEAV